MVMIRKQEDFTENKFMEFQKEADNFGRSWIKLYSEEGINNYVHMIISGHIAYYLSIWKNLYRFEQEGWEHMNNNI